VGGGHDRLHFLIYVLVSRGYLGTGNDGEQDGSKDGEKSIVEIQGKVLGGVEVRDFLSADGASASPRLGYGTGKGKVQSPARHGVGLTAGQLLQSKSVRKIYFQNLQSISHRKRTIKS